MPAFVNAHGTVITIFVLLHNSSFAQPTKLSPVSSPSSTLLTNVTTTKTTVTTPTPKALYLTRIDNTSRMNLSARRSRQSPDSSYQVLAGDIAYSIPATSFTYPDYQSTYSGEISTITYPYITTPRPTLHTLRHYTQPYSAQPPRRIPTQFLPDAVDSAEDDFAPLTPMYTHPMADARWSAVPAAHRPPPPFPYPVRGTSSQAHLPTATGWSASGLSLTGGSSSGWGNVHESTAQHVIPITIHEIQHKPRIDLKKWGIIALIKIGIAKLKAFGILKLLFFLLLKYKLVLLVLFTKFMLFLKALKLLKTLLIPFLLLALLPLLLLLLPLLLLPLLLPLLLLLPVPVPALVRDKNGNARISVLSHMKVNDTDVIMDVLSQLLDSEKCVERIACQLATKKESKILRPIITWYLLKLGNVIKNDKIRSYVKAYTKTVKEYDGDGSEEDGQSWCAKKYPCAKVTSGSLLDDEDNAFDEDTKKSK